MLKSTRVPRRATVCLLGTALGLFRASPAHATPGTRAPAAPQQNTLAADWRSGRDLLASAPFVALLDGSWSVVTELDTLLTSRRWDAPYPQGLVAQVVTRTLYGTSWTSMIVLETFAASLASGGRFDWLAEAHYRTDWLFGVTAPVCPSPGAYGGCGAGAGSFGGLEVRLRGSPFWWTVTGGWLEQRIANDSQKTLEESLWVLTPLAVAYGKDARSGAVALAARLGAGAYFGMHSAHVHPTALGAETLHVPWHELYPLDVGVGPGARAELALSVAESVRLSGGAVLAPLVAGSRRTRSYPEVEPLPAGHRGVPTWRALTLGLDVSPRGSPLRFGAAAFLAELSTQPIGELGHAGFMFRFDFPLRLEPAR